MFKMLHNLSTIAMASLTLRCDSSPSLTTSCKLWANQPKLRTPMLSMAFFMLLALSRSMICTLFKGMCHWSSISLIAAEMVSLVCDPWKFLAWSVAPCGVQLVSNQWTVKLKSDIGQAFISLISFETCSQTFLYSSGSGLYRERQNNNAMQRYLEKLHACH